MTVAELIERLRQMPPDAVVVTQAGCCGIDEVEEPYVDRNGQQVVNLD